MAKGGYVGIDGVARKLKKAYVGVGGVARKIKKAYVGINGVARPCWGGGELAYYGAVTSVQECADMMAGSIGSYAVFAGGYQYDYGERNGGQRRAGRSADTPSGGWRYERLKL